MQDMARTFRYLLVLLLIGVSGRALAQTGEITGTVLDETGQGLPSASVKVSSGGHIEGWYRYGP
jgi:hypothetical protein